MEIVLLSSYCIKPDKTFQPSTVREKPTISVTLDESIVADEVVEHLARLDLFQWGGRISEIVSAGDGCVIKQLALPLIRERITQACRLTRKKYNGIAWEEQQIPPPKWLYESIFHRHELGGIRPITGIIQSPTLRADGSILQSPGWDEQTKLFLKPCAQLGHIPDNPSRSDACTAASKILQAVADFPFRTESDRSAWLSLLLTLVARSCIAGNVPIFAVTANVPGAGKGLLVDVASTIAYGRSIARRHYASEPDEQRKLITSAALEAMPAVLLDNVDQTISGSAIDAALTATVWSDRILHSNRTTGELPLRTVWIATGNNIRFGSDTARRALPIRLMSKLESPEDRTDVTHSDLLAWVRSHRCELAISALTILRAYYVAGQPPQLGQWGSYEDWTRIVRGAVTWCGLADPLVTKESSKDADETKDNLRLVIAALREVDPSGKGITCARLIELANANAYPVLSEAISALGSPNSKSLGIALTRFVGRVCGGFAIDAKPSHAGAKAYFAQESSARG